MRGIVGRGALVALLVLSVSAPAVAADDWPVVGHDPAQTRRSTVPATLHPLLRPRWPVIGASGPVRVAPGGAVSLYGIGFAYESFIGSDGLFRRLGVPAFVGAIGPDGRRYAFAKPRATGSKRGVRPALRCGSRGSSASGLRHPTW